MKKDNISNINGVDFPFVVPSFATSVKLYLVKTKEQWDAFFIELMKQKLVACDTETEGFDFHKGHRICGMSFGWDDTHFYVPVRHKASALDPSPPTNLDMAAIKPDLIQFFEKDDTYTIWHNWKFDSKFFRMEGIEINGVFHDTRILWQLFNENAPGALKTIASGWTDDLGIRHKGLVHRDARSFEKAIDTWRNDEAKERRHIFRELVQTTTDQLAHEIKYQGWKKTDLKRHVKEELLADHPYAGASKADVDYSYIPVPMMGDYAAIDTYLTWVVYKHVMANLPFTKTMRALYINELKLSRVLMDAECHGIKVDRPYLLRLQKTYEAEIADLREKIQKVLVQHTEGGVEVNLNSVKQLGAILRVMGATLPQNKDTGNYQLDKKVLNKLRKTFPVCNDILELRKIEKLLNTYVVGILEKATEDDILHVSFNQNVTTGRMSCFTGDATVRTRRGSVPISQVCVGDEVWTHKQRWKRVTAVLDQGVRAVETFALSNGNLLHATADHPMFRSDGTWATLGSIADEHIQEMGSCSCEPRRSSRCVPSIPRTHCADSPRLGNDTRNGVHDPARGPGTRSVCSTQGTSLLPLQGGHEESYAWEDGRGTSQLEGDLRGRARVPDLSSGRQAPVCAPCSDGPGTGLETTTSHNGCASYRRGSQEQQLRQSGVADARSTPAPAYLVGTATTETVTARYNRRACQVYDLTVEDDHSFLVEGVFAHNCQNPNLQNIPGRGRGEEIRRAFINLSPEYAYILADYSQVEVRLTAHFSRDPLLLKSYELGEDVHLRTACEMFGMDYDRSLKIYEEADKTNPEYNRIKTLRGVAKVINFGIIYGVSALGLSDQIPRPTEFENASDEVWVEECQRFINIYLAKYRGVRAFIGRMSRAIKEHAYVTNYFGRIRRLPHAQACRMFRDASKVWLEKRAKRQGINYIVQGTAADVFKFAVVRVGDLLRGTKSKIVNFVHDEIQIYLHKDELHLLKEIKRVMEDFHFIVPLIVDVSWTQTSWADKKDLKH